MAAPVAPIRVNLARRPKSRVRTMYFLRAPVVVLVKAPLPPVVVHLARAPRRPKTMALLFSWTIRGPPASTLTQAQTTVKVKLALPRRRTAARSFLLPPTVLAVFSGARVTLARGRRPATRSRLFPPTIIAPPGIPRPIAVTLVRGRRPRVFSRLFPPAVVAPAATSGFVARPTVVVRPARPARKRPTSFLRAPVVLNPYVAPPADPVVVKIRTTFAPSRVPARRTRSQTYPGLVAQPTSPQQTQIFAPRPPSRPRSNPRSFLGKPIVAPAAAAAPVVTATRVVLARSRRRPFARVFLGTPIVAPPTSAPPVVTAARVVLAKSRRRPFAKTFLGIPIVGAAASSPPVVTATRVVLARPRRRPFARVFLGRPAVVSAPAPSLAQSKIGTKLAATARYARVKTKSFLLPPRVIAAAVPAPPTFTVNPVASGTTTVGSTLSCTTGTAAGDPVIAYAFQWQRDGNGNGVYSNIAGSTGSTIVLTPADLYCFLRCVVTATNGVGTANAASNALGPVTDPTSTPAQTRPRRLPRETRKRLYP